MNRCSLLSCLPFLGLPRANKPKSLWVNTTVITKSMVIDTFNGFKFPFKWHLEPGDIVNVRTKPSINAIFVHTQIGEHSLFAWSFHARGLASMFPIDVQKAADLSFRRGHELWPKNKINGTYGSQLFTVGD